MVSSSVPLSPIFNVYIVFNGNSRRTKLEVFRRYWKVHTLFPFGIRKRPSPSPPLYHPRHKYLYIIIFYVRFIKSRKWHAHSTFVCNGGVEMLLYYYCAVLSLDRVVNQSETVYPLKPLLRVINLDLVYIERCLIYLFSCGVSWARAVFKSNRSRA